MGKIVAIGGGSVGRGGTRTEVTPISREIIRLSGKKKPQILFIPTASFDDPSYISAFQDHFGKQLACCVDVLCICLRKPSVFQIARKIHNADIIYVGGGNTLMMMNRWKKFGIDPLLRQAWSRGKVLCGTSAGAICWFRQGNSDSRKYKNPKAGLIKVTGLGLIDAMVCPHYDVEKDREPELKRMMRKTPGVAIALDNCAALEIVGNQYRLLTCKPLVGGYKVYWLKGKYFREKLAKGRKWAPLSTLLSKERTEKF